MKKRSLIIVLASVLVLTATSFLISGYTEKKAPKETLQVEYYWFDTNTTWLGRQNTIADEEWLTDLNAGTYNPKTLVEKGWRTVDCTVPANGIPIPNYGTPDVVLYSHP